MRGPEEWLSTTEPGLSAGFHPILECAIAAKSAAVDFCALTICHPACAGMTPAIRIWNPQFLHRPIPKNQAKPSSLTPLFGQSGLQLRKNIQFPQ
jgi:hypothetical protein